ncbi:MAG: exodeoxyribonuclease VII large subunit, partial [Lachnospiraceae bacterium]|nr:exodeoxyribonuclease VII large subunit [Lachnospiraceae bacterium]
TLRQIMDQRLQQKKHQLALYIEGMKGLSPLNKLNQGFSFVQSLEGIVVKNVADTCIDDRLEIFVTDGKIETTVTKVIKEDYFGKIDK